MDCRTARRLAERRADREAFDCEGLKEHLRGCAGCHAYASTVSMVASALSSAIRSEEPRSGFDQRVAHRLERKLQETAARGLTPRWRPAWMFVAGVAAGLLLSAGLFSGNAGRRPTVIPQPIGEAFAPVGSVVAGAESVEVLSPNGGTGQQPDFTRLKPDSTVWVAREGTAEVELRDGGRVRFGHDSVVRFRKNGLVLYRGVVHLSVRRGEEPFTVELPQGYVMTDEAEFRVRLDARSSKAEVEMLTGFAWLGNPSGSIAVADGETAEVRPNTVPALSST